MGASQSTQVLQNRTILISGPHQKKIIDALRKGGGKKYRQSDSDEPSSPTHYLRLINGEGKKETIQFIFRAQEEQTIASLTSNRPYALTILTVDPTYGSIASLDDRLHNTQGPVAILFTDTGSPPPGQTLFFIDECYRVNYRGPHEQPLPFFALLEQGDATTEPQDEFIQSTFFTSFRTLCQFLLRHDLKNSPPAHQAKHRRVAIDLAPPRGGAYCENFTGLPGYDRFRVEPAAAPSESFVTTTNDDEPDKMPTDSETLPLEEEREEKYSMIEQRYLEQGLALPEHLTCPITLGLMRTPVLVLGHNIEKKSVLYLIQAGNGSASHPITRGEINKQTPLAKNDSKRSEIDAWVDKQLALIKAQATQTDPTSSDEAQAPLSPASLRALRTQHFGAQSTSSAGEQATATDLLTAPCPLPK